MYTHMEVVPEVSTNVLEPVAEQVVRYIISQIGFSNIFDNNLMFEGSNETTSKTTDELGNRKLIGNKIICNVSNILSPMGTPWDGINSTFITSEGYPLSRLWNQYPFFSDIINKLFLFTMDRPASILCDCTFHIEDRTQAYEVGSRMFTQFSNGQTIPVMDIMFDYPIPEKMLENFLEMYRMTAFAENPLNNFIGYLKDGSNRAITVKRHRLKKNIGQIVVQKTITNCLVKIEFHDDQVTADKRNKLPIKFTNQMSLTIQFMKPDDILFQFPPVINNKLVPIEFIPDHDIPVKPPAIVYPEISIDEYLKDAAKEREDWVNNGNIVRIPPWDNWNPPKHDIFPGAGYKPIVIVVIEITGPPWETWLHLVNDIQKATMVSNEIITFIKSSGNAIFFKGLPVLMVVYRDDEILDQSHLRIENDFLVIKTDQKHKIHRVVIYVQSEPDAGKIVTTNMINLFDIIVNR